MKSKLSSVILCLMECCCPAAGLAAGEIRFKDLVADENVVPINRMMEVADDALYLRPGPGAGFVWIPALEFTEGVIDVELRGRDATGQSFVGLAFHAKRCRDLRRRVRASI